MSCLTAALRPALQTDRTVTVGCRTHWRQLLTALPASQWYPPGAIFTRYRQSHCHMPVTLSLEIARPGNKLTLSILRMRDDVYLQVKWFPVTMSLAWLAIHERCGQQIEAWQQGKSWEKQRLENYFGGGGLIYSFTWSWSVWHNTVWYARATWDQLGTTRSRTSIDNRQEWSIFPECKQHASSVLPVLEQMCYLTDVTDYMFLWILVPPRNQWILVPLPNICTPLIFCNKVIFLWLYPCTFN